MASNLPPLNAIRAFHAASIHLNFSRAADELGVTQGAVSKQVISLENHIGAQLFIRQAQGLELTVAGHSLKVAILPAFDALETAFAHYQRRDPRSKRFRIATVGSFAAHSLVPRLDQFREAFPDLDLEIYASDRLIDLDLEEVDFSIRFGLGTWKGLSVENLSGNKLIPVCHPDLVPEPGANLEDWFPEQPRVQAFSKNEWKTWCDEQSIPMPEECGVLFLEDFLVALQAVRAGHGLALLPDSLVATSIREGALKVFSAHAIDWPQAYYLAYVPGVERRRVASAVLSWMKQEISVDCEEVQALCEACDYFS